MNLRLPFSNLRSQFSNLRSQFSNLKSQFSNPGSQFSNLRSQFKFFFCPFMSLKGLRSVLILLCIHKFILW